MYRAKPHFISVCTDAAVGKEGWTERVTGCSLARAVRIGRGRAETKQIAHRQRRNRMSSLTAQLIRLQYGKRFAPRQTTGEEPTQFPTPPYGPAPMEQNVAVT